MNYLKGVTSLEYRPERCTGCRRCTEVCPHRVFAMDGARAMVTDRDLCMECGACMKNCAFGAIRVDAGVGCASAIINGMRTGGEPTCGCDEGPDTTNCC